MRTSTTYALLAIACLLDSFGAAVRSHGSSSDTPPPQVTVLADGELRELPTSAATVADLLTALEINLGPLDRTDHPPGTPITDGLRIRITRVVCREVTEEIPLRAGTMILADPDRPAGYTKILARGKDGQLRRVWRIWEKDGRVTSRSIASEQTLVEPRDAVVLRGVKGVPSDADYLRNWRTPLRMDATAYEPGPRSCGRWATGYTAIGLKAQKGVVAVDDRVIPMGTRLYIPIYGFAIAADRGAAIKGMRIDLCFLTYEEAIQFGRRRVNVYRLD